MYPPKCQITCLGEENFSSPIRYQKEAHHLHSLRTLRLIFIYAIAKVPFSGEHMERWFLPYYFTTLILNDSSFNFL